MVLGSYFGQYTQDILLFTQYLLASIKNSFPYLEILHLHMQMCINTDVILNFLLKVLSLNFSLVTLNKLKLSS